jgi:hypothetical protein
MNVINPASVIPPDRADDEPADEPAAATGPGEGNGQGENGQAPRGPVSKALNDFTSLETSLLLLKRGFHPTVLYPRGVVVRGDKPEDGKRPMGNGWALKRITQDLIYDRHLRFPDAEVGVGLCLGPGKGPDGRWLIDLEGDGPEADASRAVLFAGEEPDTVGWSSTRGPHQLFIGDDRLAKIIAKVESKDEKGVAKDLPGLPGLEFRIGREGVQIQSACPPTPGTDGTPRRWNTAAKILKFPEAAYATLERIASEAGTKARAKPQGRVGPEDTSDPGDVAARSLRDQGRR